jgi:hypothetical protein
MSTVSTLRMSKEVVASAEPLSVWIARRSVSVPGHLVGDRPTVPAGDHLGEVDLATPWHQQGTVRRRCAICRKACNCR